MHKWTWSEIEDSYILGIQYIILLMFYIHAIQLHRFWYTYFNTYSKITGMVSFLIKNTI